MKVFVFEVSASYEFEVVVDAFDGETVPGDEAKEWAKELACEILRDNLCRVEIELSDGVLAERED